jgi:septal ring factor EnvC (AmiA/AmiB activator)
LSLRARTPALVAALAVAISLALVAALAVATSPALPRAAAQDKRDQLSQTQNQLGDVEAVLRNARADADALAKAVAQADQAVAGAQARLDQARAREADARSRRAAAGMALDKATAEVRTIQGQLAEQARQAYMTGGVLDLAALVSSPDLPELADRAATLNYVAARGQETLGQLDLAKQQADAVHAETVAVEREREAATGAVRRELATVEHVQQVRHQAKQALDAKVGKLARQAASLRARSQELRRLIRQEEAARAREAAARRASQPSQPPTPAPPVPLTGGLCDLSSTSAAERWIIMHESGGDPTAQNPSSTAFGLGQLLLGNRILYLGQDYATTDCSKQLSAFRAYVRDRYGTAEAAQAFWQANGWY